MYYFTEIPCYHYIGTTRPELHELCAHVTPRYAAYWKEIGILLGFNADQLEIIRCDNLGNTQRSCNGMFNKWLQTNYNATWEMFFKAFDLAIEPQPINVYSSK